MSARSPFRGVQWIDVSLTHPYFSPSLSPSLPLSLNKLINKIFKIKKKKKKWLFELAFISKIIEKNPFLSLKLRYSGLTLLIKKTLKN